MQILRTCTATIIASIVPTIILGADSSHDIPALPPAPSVSAPVSAGPLEKPLSSSTSSKELPALPLLNATGTKEDSGLFSSPSSLPSTPGLLGVPAVKTEQPGTLDLTPALLPNVAGQPLFPDQQLAALHFYPVSCFTFKYEPESAKPNPKLPTLAKLCATTKVKLVQAGGGYTAPAKGAKVKAKEMTIAQLPVNAGYSAEALQAIFSAIVGRLNENGIYGVLVIPNPVEMDSASGQDFRTASKDLHVQIYISEIKQVRTIFKTNKGAEKVVDDGRHSWIAADSPLKAGSLLEKTKLQDYLSRLNQFPGRRVDSSISSTGDPGSVVLDYLVQEEKHISAYAEVSNAGTRSVGDWAERVGVIWRDPIPHDSLLNLEFGGAGSLDSESVTGSYQQPILLPNVLTAMIHGTWQRYTANDVGLDSQNFDGTSAMGGARLTLSMLQWKGIPINVFVGAEYYNIGVDNKTFSQNSDNTFLLPDIGLSTSFANDRYTFSGEFMVEKNIPGIAGTDASDLAKLGRFSPSSDFTIARGSAAFSFFLEPLLFGKEWYEGNQWRKATLAHEFAFFASGQMAMNNARPVPQFEQVVGGFGSVRGYPESICSGDEAMAGTVEYRLHLPRLLKPLDAIAKDKTGAGAPQDGVPKKSPFLFRPPTVGSSPYGRPDWDLILRAFIDAGATFENNPISSLEADHTLAGAGVGLELQARRNLNVRIEWGTALLPVTISTNTQVRAGDNRYHLVVSLTW